MRSILTSILAILTLTGIQAQSSPGTPKLVVGLTIDQLRTDYIEAFSALYGEKGFKRLWREGKIYLNAEYNFASVDRASAMAAIYSGTSPSMNGIVSSRWLDSSTLRPVSCVEDASFIGYYTGENSSAAQLLTSTIADELKLSSQGRALVYAIAPFREAAIFGAGHNGNGAFWVNDMTGKWCGTTYYGDFPLWVSSYNDSKAVDTRIATMTWAPSLQPSHYINIPAELSQHSFNYKFEDAKRNKFKRFINSPLVNDEVNLLVENFLDNSTIGQDNITDLLSVTYNAGSQQDAPLSMLEVQDTYVRLDRSLARLLDSIDKKIGLNNVLFFITSTSCSDTEPTDYNQYKIPGGEFHINRCTALLNMFLMATYGDGQYIEGHHGTQIYLNKKLIEQKQLNLAEIQTKAADFLIQFSGVNEVYSSHRLLMGAWNPEMAMQRNAYHRKRSGDLMIDVLPGWSISEENNINSKIVRHTYIPMPLIFMGYSVKPEIIHTPVTMDHIAPTVAYFMRIRAPNACTAKRLSF
ncbi:alkaline phosphatase family protein [Bacteroides sp. 519]|uniref:alkaline phosphatase family protein n=1 Tax=Bacteroides sp. 519 TaxID=2302937 RepID=UPI0013D13ECB|nr:alkaline phosphatase family protein [Bacteroides sp. 519]NDV58659.1 alkaline phosphatase family protein [Bacteroides sp. 519]